MRPKISVIMPVYKVEEYVGKAIESILKQTLTDFEFWVVDDGSPDNCGEICDKYAKRDPRIQVIHKENGGAPSARNMAIEQANGEYFYFMDGDDWAEPDMLEDMYTLAEKNNSQLVVSGYFIDTYFSDNKYITQHIFEPDAVYNTKEEFRRNAYKLFDHNLLYTPWNKLYKAEYIISNALRFPQTFWDDFPFNLSVVKDVERVSVTSKQYYHFMRARAESETAAYRSNMYEKREEEHAWMQDLYGHWNISDANSMEMLSRRHVERLVGCVENLTNRKCTLTGKERRALVKMMINEAGFRNSLKLARPKSFKMKVILFPYKLRNVTLTIFTGKLISFVKSRNTKMFASMKASR